MHRSACAISYISVVARAEMGNKGCGGLQAVADLQDMPSSGIICRKMNLAAA